MKSITIRAFNYLAAALIIASFATMSFGQTLVKTKVKNPVNVVSAPNASVAPVLFEGPGANGNPNCGTLNGLHTNGTGDIRFSHILTDNELKLDFGTPNGTFAFTTGNGQIVVGPQSASQFVTVSSSGSTVSSWGSTLQITAVILKVGSDAYVYPYKPFKMSDTDLITGDNRSISHLTFCFGEPANPTAADGTVSGRVVDANGMGISKAQLVLIDGETGEAKITLTTPFGYYTIGGAEVGRLYVLNVSHKRYSFAEAQRIVSLTDSVTDVDFVAVPLQ